MRILLLKSRVRSQIAALDQRKSTDNGEARPPQANNMPDIEGMLRALSGVVKEDEIAPAILKSLSVNYDGKGRWLSSNPLATDKEAWTAASEKGEADHELIAPNCINCKYKEGLEELLNILSVCGFITKPTKDKVEQEAPVPAIRRAPPKEQSGVRIIFKGKSGLSQEFYY